MKPFMNSEANTLLKMRESEAIHELGSEHAVKEAGKIRTEGKGYYPKDGDIMFFRFNVKK